MPNLTEKYRPRSWDEVVGQEDIVRSIRANIANRDKLGMPHYLFCGAKSGTGKTTIATLIAKDLDVSFHEFNASDERGIDFIRDEIKKLSQFRGERVIFLDEADQLCLHPDTEVIVGDLNNLNDNALKDLPLNTELDIPSFNTKTWQIENDKGVALKTGKAKLYRVKLTNNKEILASEDHPFFIENDRNITEIKLKDLDIGTEILNFDNRFMNCSSCGKRFYKKYPWYPPQQETRFCSVDCRNKFFGSLSTNRPPSEQREMAIKGNRGLWTKFKNDPEFAEQYREKQRKKIEKMRKKGTFDPGLVGRWAKVYGGPWKGIRQPDWMVEKRTAGFNRMLNSPRGEIYRQKASIQSSRRHKEGVYDNCGFYFVAGTDRPVQAARAAQLVRKSYKGLENKVEKILKTLSLPYEKQVIVRRDDIHHTLVDFIVNKVAIYASGCFWHVCKECNTPIEYDFQKYNVANDILNIENLEMLGYRVLVLWEHEFTDLNAVKKTIMEATGISGVGKIRLNKAKITSIEYAGVFDVYNIEIKNNKNFFLSNGILTHNTNPAQNAMRRTMERTEGSIFILTGNYENQIIDAIKSRCVIHTFPPLRPQDVQKKIVEIIKGEQIKLDLTTPEKQAKVRAGIGRLVEQADGDLRSAINNLIKIIDEGSQITPESVAVLREATSLHKIALDYALKGDFESAKNTIEKAHIEGRYDSRLTFRELYKALETIENRDIKIRLYSKLGEVEQNSTRGSDPIIQICAFLAYVWLVPHLSKCPALEREK